MLTKYKWLSKAIHGSLVSGLTATGFAIKDGEFSGYEMIMVALAVVVSFEVIFQSGPTLPPVGSPPISLIKHPS
jgi:hypothetical protein